MNYIFYSIFTRTAWQRLAKILIFTVLGLSISACDILGDDDDDDPAVVSNNSAPTADAGANQEVDEGASVTLSGSGSDSDGTIASYAWTHLTSNSDVTLSGADTTTASFTAPEVSQDTELAFRLTVTDDDGDTATSDTYVTVLDIDDGGDEVDGPSSQILFASQYDLIEGANNEPYATSQESGDVIAFSDADGSGFEYDNWGLGVAPDGGSAGDYMQQRQAYGLQFAHSTAVDSSHYFGLVVKAPGNADLNISKSDTLVIQMGNGASTDDHANSHMTFTVELNGGTYSDNSWSNSCSFDQELLANSRPGTDQASWGNPYGIHTYRIALSGFTCSAGDLSALQSELEEVAIKVVGGKDTDASASTSGNSTLLQFGFITFVNSSNPVKGDSEYILFASQYEGIDGASQDPWVRSQEGGEIYSFSNGFTYRWGLGEVPAGYQPGDLRIQRQAYGLQFDHGSAVDSNNYFGLTIKAPNNAELDITNSETLIIQMGNGANTTDDPNSHMTFTIDLTGDGGSNLCSHDQVLLADSRPLNNNGGTNATWGNPYGIHTYRIALSDFACSSGSMDALKADLEEVVVKVVGGKDASASASSSGNDTLLQFGYIAFGPSEL